MQQLALLRQLISLPALFLVVDALLRQLIHFLHCRCCVVGEAVVAVVVVVEEVKENKEETNNETKQKQQQHQSFDCLIFVVVDFCVCCVFELFFVLLLSMYLSVYPLSFFCPLLLSPSTFLFQ